MKLETRNIIKSYQEKQVLQGVSLSLNEGELTTLFGVSGSGKSTLLKLIAGIEKVDQGQILLDGNDITTLLTEKREIGYIFQKPTLFPHMTVAENILFGLTIKKVSKKTKDKKLEDMLSLLRLEDVEHKYPHQISGGQQQRVALGRALSVEPKLLLMDEPFTGLDYDLRFEMGKLIKKLQQNLNLTILFVTHDIDECLKLSDKIAILEEGTILQLGSVDEVYLKPRNKTVASLMGEGNYIDGIVQNKVFYCDLGNFVTPNYQDGTYALFIRPERMTFSKKLEGALCNIKKIIRVGKSYSIFGQLGNQELVVSSPINYELAVGEKASLNFYVDDVHLMHRKD